MTYIRTFIFIALFLLIIFCLFYIKFALYDWAMTDYEEKSIFKKILSWWIMRK